MTDKKPSFWYSMLRDDDGDFCLCRFLLLLSPLFGLLTMFVYCHEFKNLAGETAAWDALIATSGVVFPVVCYVFTRLYESREWIATKAKEWTDKKES